MKHNGQIVEELRKIRCVLTLLVKRQGIELPVEPSVLRTILQEKGGEWREEEKRERREVLNEGPTQ